MRIKPKTAYMVEVFGLVVILLSVGWQVFIEEDSQELAREAEIIQLNEKLDDIWLYVGRIGGAVTQDSSVGSVADYETLNKHWRYVSQETNFDYTARLFRLIRGILFLFGTVMLSIGRYYELRERLETRAQPSINSSRE